MKKLPLNHARLLFVCAHSAHAIPRDDADAVIASLKQDDHNLDLSRMRKGEEGVWKERSEAGKLVKFGFPNSVGMDAFYYTISIDEERREFLVRRTGGFAPQNLLYGPGKLR